MIRLLAITAAVGFLLSLAALSAAAALAGPGAFHHDWRWTPGRHLEIDLSDAAGPQATRAFAWPGGDTLEVRVPAEVRYTQKAGPASLTLSGPAAVLDDIRVEDGAIRSERHAWRRGKLTIVLSAPDVSRFELSGANRLTIDSYDQDRLSLDLSGASEVKAKGKAKALRLDISGAGDADLGGLKVGDADLDISGAGKATIAATGQVEVNISGMGDVELLSEPARLETDISGAGKVRRPQPAPAGAGPAKPA